MDERLDNTILCDLKDYRGVHVSMFISDKNDVIQDDIYKYGKITNSTTYMSALPYIPHNPIVLDIGAHIGSSTMWFYQTANAKKIISIEPNPATFALLKKSVEINGLQDVIHPMNVAVGERECRVKIAYTKARNTGNTVFHDCPANSGLSIPCTTVDKIVGQVQEIDFMKIDVEGSELKVLKGAKETIERTRPTILIEIWSPSRMEVADPGIITGTNFMDVMRFFGAVGYVMEKSLGKDDFMFIPEEKAK